MPLYGAGNYGAGVYGGTPIRMSFNAKRDALIICKGTTSYILEKNGLVSLPVALQDFHVYKGQTLVHSPAAISQPNIAISSNILTMGTPNQKYLWGVGANIICTETVNISVSYREQRSGAYVITTPKPFDVTAGYTKVGYISGAEFIIHFTVDNYTTFSISDLFLRYSNKKGSFLAKSIYING